MIVIHICSVMLASDNIYDDVIHLIYHVQCFNLIPQVA
jgi:hypothetical protein